MKNRYAFLYHKPGRLFPSEEASNWFEEESFSVDDLKKELFSSNSTAFLETLIGLFLFDEIQLDAFLSFMGDHERKAKGLILFKERPEYVFEIIAFASKASTGKENIDIILITLNQREDISDLFALDFAIDTSGNMKILSNYISPHCTGVAIMQSFFDETTVLLSYRRELSPS